VRGRKRSDWWWIKLGDVRFAVLLLL
jgi:hypothetical protein